MRAFVLIAATTATACTTAKSCPPGQVLDESGACVLYANPTDTDFDFTDGDPTLPDTDDSDITSPMPTNWDTVAAYYGWAGDATVQPNGSYAGSEFSEVYYSDGVSLFSFPPQPYSLNPNAQLICQYESQVTNSSPSAMLSTCQDASGNPCAWAFDITLGTGRITQGDRNTCIRNFGTATITGLDLTYGFIPNYNSLGPTLMFYYSGAGYYGWYVGTGAANWSDDFASWNSNNGKLKYDWPYNYVIAYVP